MWIGNTTEIWGALLTRLLDFQNILDSFPAFRFLVKTDSFGLFPESYPKKLKTFQKYPAFQKKAIFKKISLKNRQILIN